jgi:hypothetical protein
LPMLPTKSPMNMASNNQITVPEVDQAITRATEALEKAEGTVQLEKQDLQWLLAEIDGGRIAFGTLVQQKNGLEQQVKQMRRTIDDLLAMRGKR